VQADDVVGGAGKKLAIEALGDIETPSLVMADGTAKQFSGIIGNVAIRLTIVGSAGTSRTHRISQVHSHMRVATGRRRERRVKSLACDIKSASSNTHAL
jgi:hypothetical protein